MNECTCCLRGHTKPISSSLVMMRRSSVWPLTFKTHTDFLPFRVYITHQESILHICTWTVPFCILCLLLFYICVLQPSPSLSCFCVLLCKQSQRLSVSRYRNESCASLGLSSEKAVRLLRLLNLSCALKIHTTQRKYLHVRKEKQNQRNAPTVCFPSVSYMSFKTNKEL